MATATLEMTTPPLFLQAPDGATPVTYTAAQVRLLIGAVFPRTGITGGGTAAMRVMPREAGANNTIDVTSGLAVVGNSASGFDRYIAYLPMRTNIPLTGFNTSPTAVRTHAVYIAVYDALIAGSANTSRIVVTEDTGSGAPVPSDNPAYYMQLATFTLGPSQSTIATGNITNVARHAQFGSSNLTLVMATGFQSGVTAGYDGGPPCFAISGSRLAFSGIVARTSGTFTSGTTGSGPIVYTIATLPEGFRPKYNRYAIGTGPGGYVYRLSVFPSGAVVASIPVRISDFGPGHDMDWISLDGIEIELD